MFKHIAFACLLGVAAGAPYGNLGLGYAAVDHVSIPRYQFNYAVSDPHTGDNKAQTEYRDGGVVKGSYSVAEPDGTLRVVDYRADPVTGFHADVKRLGQAHHPQVIQKQILAAPIAPLTTSIVGLGGHGAWGGLGLGYNGLGHGYNGLGNGYNGLGNGYDGLSYNSLDLGYSGLGLGGHGWKY